MDGACIAYQDFGEGPVAIVIIHAWFSHLEIYWEEPHYELKDVPGGWRLYAAEH